MLLYHIVLLALIQGVTEFLPVSSSGHLVMFHALTSGSVEGAWDENVLFDVAVHVGTLFSVLVYFRRDVWTMVTGMLEICKADFTGRGGRLVFKIIIASLPVIIAGFIIHDLKPDILRSLEVMAWATLIFGAVLWVVDKRYPEVKTIDDNLSIKSAILIGLSQVLALIPGTSRSGITMITARALGFKRTEAARFSILLAIVAISGAGVLGAKDVIESGDVALTFSILMAAMLAFLSGLCAIALMMKWLEKATFKPFAIYRIILGVALLGMIYGGVV